MYGLIMEWHGMAMQENHHHVIPWEVGLEGVEERGGSQLLGDPWVAVHIHHSAIKVEDDHRAIAIAIATMLPHTALSSLIHPAYTHTDKNKTNRN